jgi:signal transduction histidine kinase
VIAKKVKRFFLGGEKGKKIAVIRTFALLVFSLFLTNGLWFYLFRNDSYILIAAFLSLAVYSLGLLMAENGEHKVSALVRLGSCLYFYLECFRKAGGPGSAGAVWTSSIVLGIMWATGYRLAGILSFIISLFATWLALQTSDYFSLSVFLFNLALTFFIGFLFKSVMDHYLKKSEEARAEVEATKINIEAVNRNISTILNATPNLIAIFDANSLITASSKAFRKSFPEIKSIFEMIHIFDEARHSQIVETIKTCLGEHILNFEVNQDKLPQTAVIHQENFNIAWTALEDRDGTVQKIQFEATSIEALFSLKAKVAKTEMIAAVFAAGPTKTQSFIRKASIQLADARYKAETNLVANNKEAFVSLHTAKGAARTLGFALLAERIHYAEESLLAHQLNALVEHIESARGLLENINDITKHFQANDSLLDVSAIEQALRSTSERDYLLKTLPNIRKMVDERQQDVSRIAADLGKPTPRLLLTGNDQLSFSQALADALDQVLVHVLRNALDHGLESAEERRRCQKPEQGTIGFVCNDLGNGLELEIFDDGRGLNLQKIRERALALGGLKEEDVVSPAKTAEFIFLSGFSTASEVNLVSGRGVGMDAIRSAMENLHGSVTLRLRDHSLNPAWSLIIMIPENEIFRPTSTQRAAELMAI